MDGLDDCAVTCMLPVEDMARARAFYEGSLGLTPNGLQADGKAASFEDPEGNILCLHEDLA